MSEPIKNINRTTLDAVNSTGANIAGYESVGEAVVNALTEREYAITEAILDKVDIVFGTDYRTDAASLLADAGLAARPAPEPEAPAAPLSVEDRLVLIEETQVKMTEALDRLSRIAARFAGSAE